VQKTFYYMLFTLVVLSFTSSPSRGDPKKVLLDWSQDVSTRWLLLSLESATCKTCSASHTDIQRLRNRFGKDGLRVAVIQEASPGGDCTALEWQPDHHRCDVQGELISKLAEHPSETTWLLWAWTGRLIWSGKTLTSLESILNEQASFSTTIVVEARDAKHKLDSELRQQFREILQASPRFKLKTVDESDRLQQEIQQKWLGGFMNGKKACEFRADQNSAYVLRAKLEGLRRQKRISLRLLSGEVSCSLTSSQLKIDLKSPTKSFRSAFLKSLTKLYSAADLIEQMEDKNKALNEADHKKRPPTVSIPGGAFVFGCHAQSRLNCDRDENPAREVTLAPYSIDTTEVTVGSYRACVEAKKCAIPFAFTPGCNWGKEDRDRHPINCVTWEQADAYCAFSEQRLPTEAEWERAACYDGKMDYPWGHEEPTCARAIYDEGGKSCGRGSSTAPVGSSVKGVSEHGALDLAGNVAEWVSDWYEPYNTQIKENPRGPNQGQLKIYRGGGYYDHAAGLRCTRRARNSPGMRNASLGFRCAKSK
jgi:formylglycine-generating enzyme